MLCPLTFRREREGEWEREKGERGREEGERGREERGRGREREGCLRWDLAMLMEKEARVRLRWQVTGQPQGWEGGQASIVR